MNSNQIFYSLLTNSLTKMTLKRISKIYFTFYLFKNGIWNRIQKNDKIRKLKTIDAIKQFYNLKTIIKNQKIEIRYQINHYFSNS